MTDEEWQFCNSVNHMFAALAGAGEERLWRFNVACCKRIQSLLIDDASIQALAALEQSLYIDPALAIAANRVGADLGYFSPDFPEFDPNRNFSACKAVAIAVSSSLPAGHMSRYGDFVEGARVIALNCQWAAGAPAAPFDLLR